jgi:hypothetical protein
LTRQVTQISVEGNTTSTTIKANLVPVNFQIVFTENIRLLLDGDFNEIVLLQAFRYYLQWEDPRIFDHPCFGALTDQLSVSRTEAASDNARSQKAAATRAFWLPSLELPGKAAGTDTWDEYVDYQLAFSMPWRGNVGPNWENRPFATAGTEASGYVNTSRTENGTATQICSSCVLRQADKEVRVHSQSGQTRILLTRRPA